MRKLDMVKRGAALGVNTARAAIRHPRMFGRELERLVNRIAPRAYNASTSVATPVSAGAADMSAIYDIMPMCAPIRFALDENLAETPHLNVLIPGVRMISMSGGPNTAISLCYRLAKEGVPVRFMSANTPPDEDDGPLFDHFMKLSGINERLPNVSVVDANDPSKSVVVGRRDLFFATAWWTAQMVQQALPMFDEKKFIYLIQDFEPGLHDYSSYYALAMESYGLNFLPLVNHPILAEHYIEGRIGRFADPDFAKQTIIIDPAIDRALFRPAASAQKKKRKLLFYARPTIAKRNMFELGVIALRKAIAEGLFNDEPWEFVGMGEPFTPVSLGGGHVLQCAPWLGLQGYAEQMRSADLLLSLMLAPHPSYPPLEMAACGGIAVTNEFGVKTEARLQAVSGNIIARPATVDGVMEGLRAGVIRAQGARAAVDLKAPDEWDQSFAEAKSALLAHWRAHTSTNR